MQENTIRFAWRESNPESGFATGVCLHGHTMFSEECLSFLPRYLHHVPGISQIVRRYEHGPRRIDFERAWWTPPLSPSSALDVERRQIASRGLSPIVSLTDHDNIHAGLSLSITADLRDFPISVEWTVPYRRSILHIGVHNLPAASAREWMRQMASYTADPRETRLRDLLEALNADPQTLIVLNHPFWLEEGVRDEDHAPALAGIIAACRPWLHAFEFNGTRKWAENAQAIDLAREYAAPLISGGDRHACEPSACINLSNARSFAEFASEVRDGRSQVLVLPHYRESMSIRVLEASRDILRRYPEYPDREFWTDRIFYRGDDGVARSLGKLWRGQRPALLCAAAALITASAGPTFRPALRMLLSERGEAGL